MVWIVSLITVVFAPSWQLRGAEALFETGAVIKSQEAPFYHNAYPTVARLTSGRLLAVFGAYSQDQSNALVAAAFSDDGGRSWSSPMQIVDNPGLWDGDPNIIVDGPRTFVYVTTRAVELTTIDKSIVFMTKTEGDGENWSDPVEISMPKRYVCRR